MQWSKYQQDIFDWTAHGAGSAVVVACPGSGKTTTAVEALRHVRPGLRVLFLAFNKRIANELKRRVSNKAEVRTFNALGFAAWRKAYPDCQLDTEGKKSWKILDEILNERDRHNYGTAIVKLLSLAKSSGLSVVNHTNVWQELIDLHDLHGENEDDPQRLVGFAKTALIHSINWAHGIGTGDDENDDEWGRAADKSEGASYIDFNDQQFMPVIDELPFAQFDFIFVDESQDVNAIQRQMLHRSLAPSGRLLAIGDEKQAIYGFRGSGVNSIQEIQDEFGAIRLPLSICYRCGRNIVAEAAAIYPGSIEPAENSHDGIVERYDGKPPTYAARDAILCRYNAPLFRLAYQLFAEGVNVTVQGRDLLSGLSSLIKKQGKCDTIRELLTKLFNYVSREAAVLEKVRRFSAAELLRDKCEVLQVIGGQLDGGSSAGTLLERIRQLTEDKPNAVVLSTIHKAKGLEFDRVHFLDSHLIPSKYAVQPWQITQEQNLRFVAVTRARHHLRYIRSEED